MANQRKVQPIGLIKNLKINLVRCEYKISIIVLNMGNETEIYSMFLGRPWLKQAKVNHNWGDNTLTIIAGERIMAMSTILEDSFKTIKKTKIC